MAWLGKSGEPIGLKEEHDSGREKWGVTELTRITIVTTHIISIIITSL